MRLLTVTTNYHPVMGGIETHVREVVPRLARAGVDVMVLTTDRTRDLPVTGQQDGVAIHRVPAWPRSRDWYLAPRIVTEMARQRWDLVHVQGYHTAVPPLAMLGAIRTGTPFVLTFHSGGHTSAVRHRARRLQHLALAPLVARARRLIAVSAFEVELFSRNMGIPKARFVTIQNGSFMPAPSARAAPDPDEPLILSVGRLERYKGHHRAISAMPHVLEMMPSARLMVVGAGPYEADLHRLVADLDLSERVTIGALPPGDRQQMADLLARASLIVLFSEYEANPIAVMEALALDRPVLAAKTSGLVDLAAQGLIATVPLSATPCEVASAAVRELQEPSPRRPVALPTWDACAAQLLDVYRSVVGSS